MGVDAAGEDARTSGDTPDGGPGNEVDAQRFTVCGDGPDSITCEFVVEVCRITEQGGVPTPECVALPENCDSDERLCDRCGGACVAPLDTCVDIAAMNTVRCE